VCLQHTSQRVVDPLLQGVLPLRPTPDKGVPPLEAAYVPAENSCYHL
jgi:hypothetical protein